MDRRPAPGVQADRPTEREGLLELVRVSKHYGQVRAVDEVTLSVRKGDFLTLLGPSGSGKTTVLMSIAGFVIPSSGHIVLNGKPIDHLPPEQRNFGMVFQGYALFPHLTVARNVAFSLEMRRRPRAEIAERVRRALDLVQLQGMEDRLPRQLSGGQQQRVALARALVFTPDILLLDEPLSALDKKLRAELQVELRNLHQRLGVTFICVTHDQDEAMSMSDQVAVLRTGKLVQYGTARQLYDAPETRFVADFIGGSSFLRGRVEGVTGHECSYRIGVHSLAQTLPQKPVTIGEPILVAIRPEKIALSREVPAGVVNKVTGTLVRVTFTGSSFETQLDCGEVGMLAATMPAWGLSFELKVGMQVWASWPPNASVVVKDE